MYKKSFTQNRSCKEQRERDQEDRDQDQDEETEIDKSKTLKEMTHEKEKRLAFLKLSLRENRG